MDLDGDPTTTFNNIEFGNNTFRHFTHDITDWAGSLGLNYVGERQPRGVRGRLPRLQDAGARRAARGSRARPRSISSMPARCGPIEGGVKTQLGRVAFTVNGFFTDLKNVIGQGAELDSDGPHRLGNPGVSGQPVVWRRAGGDRGADSGAAAAGQRHVPAGRAGRRGGQPGAVQGRAARSRPETPRATSRRPSRRPPSPTSSSGPTGTGWARGSPRARSPGWTTPSSRSTTTSTSARASPFRGAGVRLNADLLNAFQSKGLEEGNPRLVGVGGAPFFLARPLLPRRLLVGVSYDFGAGSGTTVEAEPGL